MNEEGPKIGLVEAIPMLMIVVPFDVLEAVTALISPIPVIGQISLIVMHFGDWIVLFIIQFWLIMKGLKGLWALSGNLLEFIPYVDILPLRALGLIATITLANRPETAKIAKVAGAATGKIK
jgi:hypothetical protein